MVKNKYFLTSFALLILVACASGLKEQMLDYRKSLESNDFPKAQSILEKSDLKKDPKSALLWHWENGSINLIQKKFDEAIKHFQASIDLIEEFYTTRISTVIVSAVLDDSRDNFTGAGYERSLSYYYLARSYYEKYLTTGDRKDLFGARAAILAWDSYFQQVARSGSKSIYQSDLLLKVFGAQIHEQIQGRSDSQIALQLYKDALQMADSFGGVYQYFNSQSKDFIKALKVGKGEKKFVKTQGHEDLINFLKYKILSLTYQNRRYEFDKMVRDLKASSDIVQRAKKSPNVRIILEEGLIAPKVGKEFNFGIKGAIDKVDDPKTKEAIRKHGVPMIGAFAMNVLGLVPKNVTSPGSFIFAHQMATLAVSEMAIQFEMPMIEERPALKRLGLYVLDENSKVIEVRPLALITQTSDLARMILEEEAVYEYTRRGARVALKHLTAIAAAFTLYNQFKTPDNDFIARSVALASYVGASKMIAKLEEADTRQWVSLPDGIRLQEFSLPPGKYQFALGVFENGQWNENPSKKLGDIEVTSTSALFNFRL